MSPCRDTRQHDKRQVRGKLTCGLQPSSYASFCIRADTPALAKYCVHVPRILHGHFLGAGTHLQLWLADPKKKLKQSIIDLGSFPRYLAVTYTVLTVLKRPSWHGFFTISAKPIWIHLFDYHQPGGEGVGEGQRKNQA